jgi:hypothetical protein
MVMRAGFQYPLIECVQFMDLKSPLGVLLLPSRFYNFNSTKHNGDFYCFGEYGNKINIAKQLGNGNKGGCYEHN